MKTQVVWNWTSSDIDGQCKLYNIEYLTLIREYLTVVYIVNTEVGILEHSGKIKSIPTSHLIQDCVLGVALLVWLGALMLYHRELCRPLSFSGRRRKLMRSSVDGNFVVPFVPSATMQNRSFSVVGPTTWNGLPIDLGHLPNGACSQFHSVLKTVFFRTLDWERLWVGILKGRYINFDWLIE